MTSVSLEVLCLRRNPRNRLGNCLHALSSRETLYASTRRLIKLTHHLFPTLRGPPFPNISIMPCMYDSSTAAPQASLEFRV